MRLNDEFRLKPEFGLLSTHKGLCNDDSKDNDDVDDANDEGDGNFGDMEDIQVVVVVVVVMVTLDVSVLGYVLVNVVVVDDLNDNECCFWCVGDVGVAVC